MRLALTLAPVLLLAPIARARADSPPVFGIPFGCGLTFPVSQAHDTGSHVGYDTWAWDFRMPVGTPVVAAKGGVVRMARGDSKIGACDPAYAKYANYVVIDSPDGYEAQYLHFSKVVVKPGEHVQKGQLIGYSGETGWACGAHLHFKVARPVTDGWNNPSVPARIAGYGDPVLGTLISAPACKSPAPILASGKRQAAPKRPAATSSTSPHRTSTSAARPLPKSAGTRISDAVMARAADGVGGAKPPAHETGVQTARATP